MAWFDVDRFEVVRFEVAWFGVVRFEVAWSDVIRFDVDSVRGDSVRVALSHGLVSFSGTLSGV